MNTTGGSRTRVVLTLVIAVATLAGFGLLSSARSAAAAGVVPISGPWCGLTDDGGSIRMEVSPDGRFVNNIEVHAMKGSLSAREGGPMPGSQIKSGKYILRQIAATLSCPSRPGPSRPPEPCRQEPCSRTVPAGCKSIDNTTLIRGTFEAVDSLRGSFTFTVSPTYRPKRVTGQYTAWPSSVAPCPSSR